MLTQKLTLFIVSIAAMRMVKGKYATAHVKAATLRMKGVHAAKMIQNQMTSAADSGTATIERSDTPSDVKTMTKKA